MPTAIVLLLAALLPWGASGQPFLFPTANHALLEPGGEDRFFVPTPGNTWISGSFGCVRSEGRQMHEGLDIRCLERDKKGEPIDEVKATADGTVAYVNTRTGLSNYGNYIVLRHRIDGLEIYSLYAHLRAVQPGVKPGAAVKAGEWIGTMGRTTNTRTPITKERAHVHFELNLLLNERYNQWHQKNLPITRNDHGIWNGQNLLGLDPRLILLGQSKQQAQFNLVNFARSQHELCRIQIRERAFPWLKRYPMLIRSNPTAEKEGIAGYEIALNYNGMPFELIPKSSRELKSPSSLTLLSVNEEEERTHPCRKLVIKRGASWELTERGKQLIGLLVF